MKDLWAKICRKVHEHPYRDEHDFEIALSGIFEYLLGWQVDEQRRIPVGNGNSLQPDLLLLDGEGKKCFVVEMKARNIVPSSKEECQLASYMKQMMTPYGLLIGSEIVVMRNLWTSEPEVVGRVHFDNSSADGERLATLLAMESFADEEFGQFCDELKEKAEAKKQAEAARAAAGPARTYMPVKTCFPLGPEGPVRRQATGELKIGETYGYKDIKAAFACANSGGMRWSSSTNTLVLFSKHDGKNPYLDDRDPLANERNDDNVMIYTGMGMRGDQDVNRGANWRLATARRTGIKVVFFDAFGHDMNIYRGEVELVDEPYWDEEPGDDGKMRKVVKFKLKFKEI